MWSGAGFNRALARHPPHGYNRPTFRSLESNPPMYTLARQLLFKLSPETSHDLSLDLIGAGGRLGLNGLLCKAPAKMQASLTWATAGRLLSRLSRTTTHPRSSL